MANERGGGSENEKEEEEEEVEEEEEEEDWDAGMKVEQHRIPGGLRGLRKASEFVEAVPTALQQLAAQCGYVDVPKWLCDTARRCSGAGVPLDGVFEQRRATCFDGVQLAVSVGERRRAIQAVEAALVAELACEAKRDTLVLLACVFAFSSRPVLACGALGFSASQPETRPLLVDVPVREALAEVLVACDRTERVELGERIRIMLHS